MGHKFLLMKLSKLSYRFFVGIATGYCGAGCSSCETNPTLDLYSLCTTAIMYIHDRNKPTITKRRKNKFPFRRVLRIKPDLTHTLRGCL